MEWRTTPTWDLKQAPRTSTFSETLLRDMMWACRTATCMVMLVVSTLITRSFSIEQNEYHYVISKDSSTHLQEHPLEAHVLEYVCSESGEATLYHRVPRAGPALKCLLSFPHMIEDLHKHIASCHATILLRKWSGGIIATHASWIKCYVRRCSKDWCLSETLVAKRRHVAPHHIKAHT